MPLLGWHVSDRVDLVGSDASSRERRRGHVGLQPTAGEVGMLEAMRKIYDAGTLADELGK